MVARMTRKQAIKDFKRKGMIIPESAVELAISDMEKLEKIEQIVNCELIAGRRNYKSCYAAFYEIVDVIQDREVLDKE